MRKDKTLPILIGTPLLGSVLILGLLDPQTETNSLPSKAGDGQRSPHFKSQKGGTT